MSNPSTSVRLTTLSRLQLQELQEATGLKLSQVIATAIDRMWQQELGGGQPAPGGGIPGGNRRAPAGRS